MEMMLRIKCVQNSNRFSSRLLAERVERVDHKFAVHYAYCLLRSVRLLARFFLANVK